MEPYKSYYREEVVPAYPSRKEYTTFFGYNSGKVIGGFPTKEEATEAGASVVESVFDEAGYDDARAVYGEFYAEVFDRWFTDLKAETMSDNSINEATFNIIYSAAYDRGHSYGYDEVASHVDSYASLANRIIAANAK